MLEDIEIRTEGLKDKHEKEGLTIVMIAISSRKHSKPSFVGEFYSLLNLISIGIGKSTK